MSRRVQTLLFTDIVGSTDRLRDLGMPPGRLLARHHEAIRAVVTGHGGREVDTAGDGLLARFDAPAPALRAAVAAVAAHELAVGDRGAWIKGLPAPVSSDPSSDE